MSCMTIITDVKVLEVLLGHQLASGTEGDLVKGREHEHEEIWTCNQKYH